MVLNSRSHSFDWIGSEITDSPGASSMTGFSSTAGASSSASSAAGSSAGASTGFSSTDSTAFALSALSAAVWGSSTVLTGLGSDLTIGAASSCFVPILAALLASWDLMSFSMNSPVALSGRFCSFFSAGFSSTTGACAGAWNVSDAVPCAFFAAGFSSTGLGSDFGAAFLALGVALVLLAMDPSFF